MEITTTLTLEISMQSRHRNPGSSTTTVRSLELANGRMLLRLSAWFASNLFFCFTRLNLTIEDLRDIILMSLLERTSGKICLIKLWKKTSGGKIK